MSYANIVHIEAQPVSEVPGDTEEGEEGNGSPGVSSRFVRNAWTQKLQAAIRFRQPFSLWFLAKLIVIYVLFH